MNHCLAQVKSYFIIFIGILYSASTFAHPHAFVTVESSFSLDQDYNLTSISQTWEFDFFYSTLLLAEAINDWGEDMRVTLKKQADEFIDNLEAYHYFSVIKTNDNQVKMDRPKGYELRVVDRPNGKVLQLDMMFEIADSISLNGKGAEWRVYDPTYYVAYSFNHDNTNPKSPFNHSETNCSSQRIEPNPSEELIDYATSLDQTQKDSFGLGEKFAEVLTLRCSN